MYLKYGTSGFRFKVNIILNISLQIGRGIAGIDESLGIMITASHNSHKDNGIKVVNKKGEMLNEYKEQFLEKVVNNNYIPKLEISYPHNIYIGMDTRKDCKEIYRLLVEGMLSINPALKIYNYGIVTTPQHHYLTKNNLIYPNSYIQKYKNGFSLWKPKQNLIVDCANGVGFCTLNPIIANYNLDTIELINIDTKNYEKLNKESGSDYVISNRDKLIDRGFCCSLDGDADRFVFHYGSNILDGDYLSALYLLSCIKALPKNYCSIGLIYTGYTNRSFLKYVDSLDYNIDKIITPTGVKHLHHEALKYDIGIYFESNGHGTILLNKNLDDIPYFSMISKLNNSVVGDGISGIFCTLYNLEYCNLSYVEWFSLFEKNKFQLFKITVKDKTKYKTDRSETRLLSPTEIQNSLDNLMKKNDCFIFIRPSGTEDVIRVYIEFFKEENSKEMIEKIKEICF